MNPSSPEIWLALPLLVCLVPLWTATIRSRPTKLPNIPGLLKRCVFGLKTRKDADFGMELTFRYVHEAYVAISAKFPSLDPFQVQHLLMEEFRHRSGCRDPKLLTLAWARIQQLTNGKLI